MKDYLIFTDSGADISPATLGEWGVGLCSLTLRFEGEEREYGNFDLPPREFYRRMRAGGVPKTAAVNAESFITAFREVLKGGRDILYIGFSSALSSTYNAARLAKEALREEYPEGRIITVDSLSASAGQGLLVYLACRMREGGAALGECADYLEETKMSIAHLFTVDDLTYLKRGGRISAGAALVGNALGIKPLLHVDEEGRLVSYSRERGRRRAVSALAARCSEAIVRDGDSPVFISHADCPRDVELLREELAASGVEVSLVTDVGPVIGSHSGPGTLALFFLGNER